jgi:hypothetical protein
MPIEWTVCYVTGYFHLDYFINQSDIFFYDEKALQGHCNNFCFILAIKKRTKKRASLLFSHYADNHYFQMYAGISTTGTIELAAVQSFNHLKLCRAGKIAAAAHWQPASG